VYSRLSTCKELAAAAADEKGDGFEAPPGIATPPVLAEESTPAAHFYEHLLHSFEQLFDNEIEQSTFEDILRYMFGIKAYQLFTADKLIATILKQV
jgi:paired amphipathic helix protein Sin3a